MYARLDRYFSLKKKITRKNVNLRKIEGKKRSVFLNFKKCKRTLKEKSTCTKNNRFLPI